MYTVVSASRSHFPQRVRVSETVVGRKAPHTPLPGPP